MWSSFAGHTIRKEAAEYLPVLQAIQPPLKNCILLLCSNNPLLICHRFLSSTTSIFYSIFSDCRVFWWYKCFQKNVPIHMVHNFSCRWVSPFAWLPARLTVVYMTWFSSPFLPGIDIVLVISGHENSQVILLIGNIWLCKIFFYSCSIIGLCNLNSIVLVFPPVLFINSSSPITLTKFAICLPILSLLW